MFKNYYKFIKEYANRRSQKRISWKNLFDYTKYFNNGLNDNKPLVIFQKLYYN